MAEPASASSQEAADSALGEFARLFSHEDHQLDGFFGEKFARFKTFRTPLESGLHVLHFLLASSKNISKQYERAMSLAKPGVNTI